MSFDDSNDSNDNSAESVEALSVGEWRTLRALGKRAASVMRGYDVLGKRYEQLHKELEDAFGARATTPPELRRLLEGGWFDDYEANELVDKWVDALLADPRGKCGELKAGSKSREAALERRMACRRTFHEPTESKTKAKAKAKSGSRATAAAASRSKSKSKSKASRSAGKSRATGKSRGKPSSRKGGRAASKGSKKTSRR